LGDDSPVDAHDVTCRETKPHTNGMRSLYL
jgi:hypothetical protein